MPTAIYWGTCTWSQPGWRGSWGSRTAIGWWSTARNAPGRRCRTCIFICSVGATCTGLRDRRSETNSVPSSGHHGGVEVQDGIGRDRRRRKLGRVEVRRQGPVARLQVFLRAFRLCAVEGELAVVQFLEELQLALRRLPRG